MSLLALTFTAIVQFAAPQGGGQAALGAIAQADDGNQRATERAIERLERARSQRAAVRAKKATLRKTYNAQLQGVDRLKRARASWNRDRKLREQKARSQKTAADLQAVDSQLRGLASTVLRERKAVIRAAEYELSVTTSLERKRQLPRILSGLRKTLRKKPSKISIPDLDFDRLSDPEELAEQLALLEKAERELSREEKTLNRQAVRYARMVALRNKRTRANDSIFNEDGVRRSTTRVDKAAGARAAEPSAGDGFGASADSEDGAAEQAPPSDLGDSDDFEASSIVLADVVDTGTRDALRKAHRSNAPGPRAAAAKRAQKQVGSRLDRVRATKSLLKKHLQRLRKR